MFLDRFMRRFATGAALAYVSTDFVFDGGAAGQPYTVLRWAEKESSR